MDRLVSSLMLDISMPDRLLERREYPCTLHGCSWMLYSWIKRYIGMLSRLLRPCVAQTGQLYNAEDGRKALRDIFALALFDNVQARYSSL